MGRQVWKPGNMLYPLPVAMVSCQYLDCAPNIITIAWAGTVCTSPAMVSISIRPERYSYDIIHNSKEFVINLTTKQLVRAADYCGVKSGREIDKFKELKLTPGKSKFVQAPYIEESPINIECRVKEILELGSHHMFISEVVGIEVEDAYMDSNGKFELNKTGLIAYSHGTYLELGKEIGKFGYSIRKDKKRNQNRR